MCPSFSDFHLGSFSLYLESSLQYLFYSKSADSQVLLLFLMFLYCFHFLKDFFTEYSIISCQFISYTTLTLSCLCLSNLSILLLFLWRQCVFFPMVIFKMMSLTFGFQQFHYDGPMCGFLLCLNCLGFIKNPRICSLIFFFYQFFWNSQYFFKYCYYHFSPGKLQLYLCRLFHNVLWIS